MSRRAGNWIAPVAVLVGLLLIWEAAAQWSVIADALSIRDFLVPAPSAVGESLWNDRALLAADAWVTLREVLAGLALAATAGLLLAVLIHRSETARRAVYPLLVGSQTIPIVAIAPILVVWLGFGIAPKLVIVALVCFFPITVNALDGLRGTDPERVRMMISLGASRRQVLVGLELPTALPSIFSGLRIAAAVAVIGAVFAEWAGSDAGLGHLIQLASAQLLTARVFAAIVVLSAMALALFWAIGAVERRVVTWRAEPRAEAA